MFRLLTTILLLTLYAGHAHAWGWDGHRLVCSLAEQYLTDDAQAMVDELLADGGDLQGGIKTFPEACLWPDDVRHSTRKSTYEHHFVNVPDDATRIDLARDCAALNCTATAVQQALTYLARPVDGSGLRTRRAAALRFLGHFVGDLHQPMHVGNSSDWGGNKIKVIWEGKETNLHALWDYGMLESMGFSYPESLSILAAAPAPPVDNDVLGWMNESLALARTNAYVDTGGKKIRSGDELDSDYLNHNKRILLQRLVLAAHRLAHLLNEIAAGESVTVFSLSSR